jgi:hypothetical protein
VRRLLTSVATVLALGDALGATARLEVEPKTAHLGDPLAARLTVDPGTGGTVDTAPLPTEWGPAQVLSGGWEPAAAGSPVRVWSGTVAVYEIGAITIPPVDVSIAGATPSSVGTEPVALNIEGTVPPGEKPKDLADLKPPASIPPDWRPLKAALAGVLALLAAAGVAWWLWRRYAARLAAVAAPADPFRKLPPHVWVYEELERLLARRLAEEGKIGLFYDELTRIVKQYLEGRYRIELLERTTSEVPAALKVAGAPAEAALLARTLLDSGDLVKFARESAGPAECRAAVEEAYRLVDLTKPATAAAAVPAAEAAGAAR